jgi:FixJ family two-component response regulator
LHEADDGAKALALHEAYPDAVVIIDILMPGKEGLESISALLEKNAATPILAISGGGHIAGRSYLQLAARMGARVTLEKPFAGSTLLRAVKTLEHAADPTQNPCTPEGVLDPPQNTGSMTPGLS